MRKIVFFTLALLTLFNSCSSDDEHMEMSEYWQKGNGKLMTRSMSSPIVDYASTQTSENVVTNGECVIGAVVYCANAMGRYMERGEIVKYLDDRGFLIWNGDYIVGSYINSYDWQVLFRDFFYTQFPSTQYEVARYVNQIGCHVVCRINDRTHAVVLDGNLYDENSFHYYDPVKGNSVDNKVKWDKISDPVALVGVKPL